VIAFPSRHPLSSASKVSLKSLADEPFIMFPPASGLSLSHELTVACRSSGFGPIVGQVVPQISSALSLVAAELGIAAVPASVASARVPGIRFRSLEGLAPTARLALATKRRANQPVLKNFVEALLDTVGRSAPLR
jgi:DNA-binding transcriptional LysR family regulator